MSILVVDVGTSGVRVLVVEEDGSTHDEHHTPMLPSSPQPGLVEFDPAALAATATELAQRVTAGAGEVRAVAVANQRASTVVWDARTGEPVGPGLGWQDLRTVGRCLELRATGVEVAPNQSATKAEWLVQQSVIPRDDLRIGTVDSWLAWNLSGGELHVADATNAAVTGLWDPARQTWDEDLLDLLDIPGTSLPAVVDTAGIVGDASVLEGAPPITALVGDQQASLVGQGCVVRGAAKITFGTGGMLDVCLGTDHGTRPQDGTFPIVAWRHGDELVWGREAVMLSAGTAVEWLRDGLGLVSSAEATADLAGSVDDAGGVVFVPSLSGLGTPVWDHGARGLLVGVTRGTGRPHVVRAVLEGVAHRGADLVEAAERDADVEIGVLRVDGGMSRNPVFVQALADASRRPVEVSVQREATALGAGLLGGVAVGIHDDVAATAAVVDALGHVAVVEPAGELDRERFAEARDRAARWIPALSDLDL